MSMRIKFLKSRKIGSLAIMGPAIALGAIAVSIMFSPWFRWQDNAISDLGVHDVAPLFNASLVVCGILCSIFALSVILRMKSWHGRTGVLLVLLSSASLVGIGIFHENIRPWHYIFSVLFFVLLLLACLVLGSYLLRSRQTRYLGVFALATAVVGIIGWSIDWGSGIAIPEAISFVPGGIWFILLGHFYRNNNLPFNIQL